MKILVSHLECFSDVQHIEWNQCRHILFSFFPYGRLLIRKYWSRPEGRWKFEAFHIRNLFRTPQYQLSSNVEHTLIHIEFYVLVEFPNSTQGGWRLSSTKSENIHKNQYIVLYASIENASVDIHNFFRKVFQFSWRCSNFRWLCGMRIFTFITFCLVLILQHQFPGFLRNILFSTRLWISDFLIWVGQHQLTGCLCDDLWIARMVALFLASPAFVLGCCGHTGSRLLALYFPTWSELSDRRSLNWLQEYVEKFKILNKQNKWVHSSHEKLNLVRMSASWVLVLSFGFSTLILSKNQSRATLWVLDTCLIVGLCPWIIILITASLSSKMYSWDALWQECVPRWRPPPCWAWWLAWRWWWLLAFWLFTIPKSSGKRFHANNFASSGSSVLFWRAFDFSGI